MFCNNGINLLKGYLCSWLFISLFLILFIQKGNVSKHIAWFAVQP